MKFRIEVLGKDSISEGTIKPTEEAIRKRGIKLKKSTPVDSPAYTVYEKAFEEESARLEKFVKQFLTDGEGGDDSVVVEFDTDAGTCVVVPRKKVEPY